MDLKQFSPLTAYQLKILDLYSLSKSTLSYALPVKDSMSELLKAALTRLEQETVNMAGALNKTSKNSMTPLVTQKRKETKAYFAELKRNVQTASKSIDKNKKDAGEALKFFMGPFWDIDKKAMNTATVFFTEMIGKLRTDATLTAHAESIGVSEVINGLETVNNEFASLYQIRINQQAANHNPSPTQLKYALYKSYDKFCDLLTEEINYMPTAPLLVLFDQLEELRSKYSHLLHHSDDDTPENEGPEESM